MKKIRFIIGSISKRIITDLFLLVIIVYSLFSLTKAYGIYRYSLLGYDLIDSAIESDSAIYCIGYVDYYVSEDQNEKCDERMSLISKIEKMEGVSNVFSIIQFSKIYGNQKNTISLIPLEMSALYPRLNEGKWPDGPTDEENVINAVLCGQMYRDVPINSYLDIAEGYRVKVTGKIYEPEYFPNMSGDATYMCAETIMGSMSTILLPKTDNTIELYENSGVKTYDILSNANFFVDFSKDASENDIEAVTTYLQQNCRVVPVNEILQNTEEMWVQDYKKNMTKPVFFVVISGIAFICISALYIMKNLYQNAVYYLLGLSKLRIIMQILSRIVIMVTISIALNILYIIIYKDLSALEFWADPLEKVYFDGKVIAYTVIIGLIMLVVSTVMSIVVLNSNSPIEFWNKSRE